MDFPAFAWGFFRVVFCLFVFSFTDDSKRSLGILLVLYLESESQYWAISRNNHICMVLQRNSMKERKGELRGNGLYSLYEKKRQVIMGTHEFYWNS